MSLFLLLFRSASLTLARRWYSLVGKTTLLNAIANRLGDLPILSGKVSFEESTGDTSASSSPLSPSSRASKKKLRKKVKTQRKMVGKVMGFVQQSDDHLLPYLTCRETLAFAADLRLPRSTTKEERRSIVEQTLAELGLTDVAETMVGGALRKGISGGQRRSVEIMSSLRDLEADVLFLVLRQTTFHRMRARDAAQVQLSLKKARPDTDVHSFSLALCLVSSCWTSRRPVLTPPAGSPSSKPSRSSLEGTAPSSSPFTLLDPKPSSCSTVLSCSRGATLRTLASQAT